MCELALRASNAQALQCVGWWSASNSKAVLLGALAAPPNQMEKIHNSFETQTPLPFIHSVLNPLHSCPVLVSFLSASSLNSRLLLNMLSGDKPGGLQPSVAQKLHDVIPEVWKHERTSQVRNEILAEVLKSRSNWRGEYLCCESVTSKTLPRDMVRKYFQKYSIDDAEVEKQGLSLYFPGGQDEFQKSNKTLPCLVIGDTLSPSHSDAGSGLKMTTSSGMSGRIPTFKIIICPFSLL